MLFHLHRDLLFRLRFVRFSLYCCVLLFVCVVEQAEGVLVAILQKSIEFAVCYLEQSGFDDDDLGIQVCLHIANLWRTQ